MKKYNVSWIVILILLMGSCEKEKLSNVGILQIFIPQASVLDGGTTNNYPVPFNTTGAGYSNYSYSSDSSKVNVFLAVSQSGNIGLANYTVNVYANKDTAAQIVAGGTIANAVLLPADVYSLSDSVVKSSERNTNFNLVINRAKLISNYPDYYKKNMVMAVSLKNPSGISLNNKLSTVVIVLSGASFMPLPPEINLLKGGGFATGDAAYWTIIEQSKGSTTQKNTVILGNGMLQISNGTSSCIANTAVYQAVNVIAGAKYKVSIDIQTTGSISNSWVQLYLGSDNPASSDDYNQNQFLGMDTWSCLNSPLSGSMLALNCTGNAPATGIMTASTSGTLYFVLKFGSWSGNIQNLILKNAKFVLVQ